MVRVPTYSPHAVAEHTLGLILAVNRHLVTSVTRTHQGNFCLHSDVLGFDIHGKTVGVIGTGAIGCIVARLLCGFGPKKVYCFDKFLNKSLLSEFGNIVEYVELDVLLKESVVVSLHCPLIANETYHLLDETKLSLMKDNAILINTSRGGLIDTAALLKCLKKGKFSGVALDVYEFEKGVFFEVASKESISDPILQELLAIDRVILTPHQAFFTADALKAIAETTLFNVQEFCQGKRGRDMVNDITKLVAK